MMFPKDFLFGTANADHQVEAYDPDCEDVWDVWERSQGLVKRGKATDFWNRYEEDIAAAARLGCKLFRFSIAWSRVEPKCGKFDAAAISHYLDVARCVRKNGMECMVTLHHFVWPAWLEKDHGGMIGKEFPDLFARYAGKIALEIGAEVNWWITFNEPSQLTFGYIKPWWQNRYYMPPGLPRGTPVDAEAAAVGKLVPNLFLAHARARAAIQKVNVYAKVGTNPLVTGFPPWLQKLLDWAATHRRMAEALFKFTTKSALVSERAGVDLILAGFTFDSQTRFECSEAYAQTGKAVLVRNDFSGTGLGSLINQKVGVVSVGNQENAWKRDLPTGAHPISFADYDKAKAALAAEEVAAVYGDEAYLSCPDQDSFRFLISELSHEPYVVFAPHGHTRLLSMVNETISETNHEAAVHAKDKKPGPIDGGKLTSRQPISLHEVFSGPKKLPGQLAAGRGLRRVRKRGRVRIGLRPDAPGMERELAARIAEKLLGSRSALEIIPVEPSHRTARIETKTSWLNWAWRFWGTTSLIANANWWYLGMAGKLAKELCPKEAIGAQDFVGLDYYWGLSTWQLHKFRLLEEAAQGRFLRAPVWPRGLYHSLRRFARWFPDKELLIVENGCTPSAGNGVSRAEYMKLHLTEVDRALADGVNIRAYTWWSITSNREWGHPFDPNTDFGLYFVDLDKDPSLQRTASPELALFKDYIRSHADAVAE